MKKSEHIAAYFMLILLIVSLLPVIYLGRYNHPTGDDYAFCIDTHHVWEDTGSLLETMKEAARGVKYQYNNWQGTYSAMFFMHLAPNVFHPQAYDLTTFIILTLLVGGIFFLGKPLICNVMRGSKELWILWSCVLSLLCIQTVPSQAETFFWYNGSMYYTGYYALTLFFFGVIIRYMLNQQMSLVPIMVFLAFFLAGGNYVSLLPTVIITVILTGVLISKRKTKEAVVLSVVIAMLLLGLAISGMAPGNAVRQAIMWQVPWWKAIMKSLLQGVRFLFSWARIWWFMAVAIMIPAWWKSYKKCIWSFRQPLLVCGFSYAVFCSMSCPTFYTMNSTGPARAVSIMYYGFCLVTLFMVYYLLGYFYRKCQNEEKVKRIFLQWNKKRCVVGYCAALFLLFAYQINAGELLRLTTSKAVYSLVSGEAAKYEEEYLERLSVLEDSQIKEVVLLEYSQKPEMLYVGDLSADADYIVNQAVAEYFEKDSLRVIYAQ